jgi:hypothetical protein
MIPTAGNHKGVIFIANQKNTDLLKIQKDISILGIKQWLYLGEDSTWRVQMEASIPVEISRISIADILDEMAQNLRQSYIDWIGDLSQINSSFEWWSSELAGKNPYYFLFVRICLLASAQKILYEAFDKNTLIICSTPALLKCVTRYMDENNIPWREIDNKNSRRAFNLQQKIRKPIGRIAQFFSQFPIVGKYISTDQRSLESDRKKILAQLKVKPPSFFSGKETILFLTWVDRRSFASDASYNDIYFGPLPQMFKDKGYRVGFIPRVLHTIPFEEAVERLIKTGEMFFFPEQYISQNDVDVCRKRQDRYIPNIQNSSSLKDLFIGPLVAEHISETKGCMVDNMIFEPLIASMREQGISPDRIIHPCEGHCWEQALSWSVHHHMPGTQVIGYDNVTFSRMVLSMYPAKSELGLRPIPDRIVTNGPLYRETLIREGLPPENIRAGCALRHTYLWKNPPVEAQETHISHPIRILVATAIGVGDSVELVTKASEAFGGDMRYEVIIKCHPLVNSEEVKHYVGKKASSPNIVFEKSPINELLPSAHILLYTYTSVCYEAMIYGVVPVCVKAENFLNLDKLDANPDIRWMATTPEDLQKVAEEIVSMTPEARRAWTANARMIVQMALAPVNDSCIGAFINQ